MHRPERPPDTAFLVLTSLFLAALVVCNLIAGKFIQVDLGLGLAFTISAGTLPYPLTFLVTDVLSEIYGRRAANRVVWCGLVASLFVLGVLWLGAQFEAIAGSPISTEVYAHVFANNAPRTILASMVAYLAAQFLDVWLFHFWKQLTDGRHLWLRNNASTICSQLLDSALVVLVLFVGKRPFAELWPMIGSLWLFKLLCALADTPFFYLAVWLFHRAAPASTSAQPNGAPRGQPLGEPDVTEPTEPFAEAVAD